MARFHSGQDEISRAVENSAEAEHSCAGQTGLDQIEYRSAIHNCAFKTKGYFVFSCERSQLFISERNRAFVCCDHVDAALQRGSNVSDTRLAVLNVERSCFEDEVRAASTKQGQRIGDGKCLGQFVEIAAALDAGGGFHKID